MALVDPKLAGAGVSLVIGQVGHVPHEPVAVGDPQLSPQLRRAVGSPLDPTGVDAGVDALDPVRRDAIADQDPPDRLRDRHEAVDAVEVLDPVQPEEGVAEDREVGSPDDDDLRPATGS